MRLYEYEAKKIFESVGLTTPPSFGVLHSASDLDGLNIEYPAVVKAMVMTGGRGKAGGIRTVTDAPSARAAAGEILGMSIKGYPVETVLIEGLVEERGACYLGVTTNPANFNLIVMASAAGGVDIEQTALENPEAILRREVPSNDRELPAKSRDEFGPFLARGLGDEKLAPALADAIAKLFATFQKFDCKVAEINPLIVTPKGTAIAADAKVVIDDNALYRQDALFAMLGIKEARHDVSELTPGEQRARDAGFKYVDLLPVDTKPDPSKLYVGLVPGGAGYGIFSIDEVANIGDRFFNGRVVPVNFMDSGGGPTIPRVAEMFHMLMDKPIVDLIITSRFGGISSCDIFIRGLVQCLRDRHAQSQRMLPVHGRMVGTDLPSAREYLQKAKAETPEPLRDMEIVVGNQKIMADVIKDGIAAALKHKTSAR